MATLALGPTRTLNAVAATNLYTMGNASPDTVGGILLTVEGASSLSFTVRGAAPGATLDTSAAQLQYAVLSAAGTVTAGATAITANGNYVVRCDGCVAALHVTAGSANIAYVPITGPTR